MNVLIMKEKKEKKKKNSITCKAAFETTPPSLHSISRTGAIEVNETKKEE